MFEFEETPGDVAVPVSAASAQQPGDKKAAKKLKRAEAKAAKAQARKEAKQKKQAKKAGRQQTDDDATGEAQDPSKTPVEISPYTVFLGIALTALVFGTLCLSFELARYGFQLSPAG